MIVSQVIYICSSEVSKLCHINVKWAVTYYILLLQAPFVKYFKNNNQMKFMYMFVLTS